MVDLASRPDEQISVQKLVESYQISKSHRMKIPCTLTRS